MSLEKSKALLKGMQSAEWGQFMESYKGAQDQYEADVAKANAEAKKESGWMKAIGTIAFIATAFATGGWSTLASLGTAAAVQVGASALTEKVMGGYEDAADKLRGEGYDVYKPKLGKVQAGAMTGDVERMRTSGISALDEYESNRYSEVGWSTLSNVGSALLLPGNNPAIDDARNFWPGDGA
jgi:hypothetical protein